MDILIHTLSGMSVGTVIALKVAKRRRDRIKYILISAFAGAFPDIDVISHWSGFDATFGNWFGLEESGRDIYFGKHWYSHHAITHSLIASIVFALLWSIRPFLQKNIKKAGWLFVMVLLAYNAHLIGDMPTPGGSWDGINYFWPSTEYIGGTGHTWWWNNYDVFLILLSVCILNILLILIWPVLKVKWKSYLSPSIWTIGFVLCFYQITHRGVDFNERVPFSNYRSNESVSLEIQSEILSPGMYQRMRDFDNSFNLAF